MSTDRWDDEPETRGRRPNRTGDAAARVKTPGTLLFLTGLVLLALWVLNVGLILSGVDVQVAFLEWIEGMQPPGEAKQNLQKQIEEAKNRDKSLEPIQNIGGAVIGLVFNVIITLGGLKMKGLQGYGLAMAGSICAMIPCNSCCCIGFPIGLWALIVLLNADVKAAFRSQSEPVERDSWDSDDTGR